MATERSETQRKKKAFLAAFRENGIITAAARVAGVDRTTVWRWQESDERFVHDLRQAEIESTELLEQEAIRRAREGVVKETPIHHNGKIIYTVVEHKYSDNLLMFMLKGRKPETYRDGISLTASAPGGQPVAFTLQIGTADANSDSE